MNKTSTSIPLGTQVRYIKLGPKGKWEDGCLKDGIIRFGYGTEKDDRFDLCRSGKWVELKEVFLAEGKTNAVAGRFTKESRIFFEDDGSTLWITFMNGKLYWGVLESGKAEKHFDGDGVFRKVKGGWQFKDATGDDLKNDRLSGALTQLVGFRGTSCNVGVSSYVIRRINGEKVPEVEKALLSLKEMKEATLGLIRLLIPQDFELLVDLVFSSSGWQRQGVVGKTQKTIDIDLILPSTLETAFVQVKSETNQKEFDIYMEQFNGMGSYNRMFYVYHTGKIQSPSEEDSGIVVIGPEKLSEMVINAGLINWLINKTS